MQFMHILKELFCLLKFDNISPVSKLITSQALFQTSYLWLFETIPGKLFFQQKFLFIWKHEWNK
jgi:hypothetical protein